MWFEDRFIYFPTRGGRVRGPGQDVWLRANDGVKLHARYIAQPRARLHLLYLHGNAGNLADRSELIAGLARLGENLLAIDYRGYGNSEGEPSEAGLYLDAHAAYDWLVAQSAPEHVVVIGKSLGGGPATELAVTRAIGGLVLEATFTSIADMAELSIPWLPARHLLRTRFDNLGKIARARAPKLFVHSRADDVIPFAMGERLYAAAREPKRCLWLARARHNDADTTEADEVGVAMREFLASLA
jgi:uncharacterized protein